MSHFPSPLRFSIFILWCIPLKAAHLWATGSYWFARRLAPPPPISVQFFSTRRTQNIRGLNLAAVKLTTVQVSMLPL
jgi:hypothetical protein